MDWSLEITEQNVSSLSERFLLWDDEIDVGLDGGNCGALPHCLQMRGFLLFMKAYL